MFPSAADPVVTEEDARRQIESANPGLRPVSLRHLGRGWDHDVWLANDTWVVRFPRNEMAAKALVREAVFLPRLAPSLPVAVPILQWFSPQQGAHRLIHGRTVCDAGLDAEGRAAMAADLGRFFRALHHADLPRASDLPGDVLGRLDAARRLGQSLQDLSGLGLEGGLEKELRDILRNPPGHPPNEPLVVVHADPHVRNLLVDEHGTLTGVIDWVDMHFGHRALDLAVLFEVVPPQGRAAFLAAYGDVDRLTLDWARWRAADHMVRSVAGARVRGDPLFAAACLRALEELSAGLLT